MKLNQQHLKSGFSLVEVIMALAIFALILVTALTSVSRNSQQLQSVASSAMKDGKAYEMLEVIRQKLSTAQGELPEATLTADLGGAGTAAVAVTSVLGFPDSGMLLIGRGTASEERLSYTSFDPVANTFTGLTRGLQCTTGSLHISGSTICWAGLAQPIDNQVNPTANQFDGQVQELSGNFFFSGDGSGFSFRVPTDPTGGGDFITGGVIQLGAHVAGADILTGWSSLYFSVRNTVTEAGLGGDINDDGDQNDTFNLGSIRMRSWDSADPLSGVDDVGLCPPVILQEQCNWGGDLDADGFDDPIFFWDPSLRRLHVRLFVLSGTNYSGPSVREVGSVVFLRNSSPE